MSLLVQSVGIGRPRSRYVPFFTARFANCDKNVRTATSLH